MIINMNGGGSGGDSNFSIWCIAPKNVLAMIPLTPCVNTPSSPSNVSFYGYKLSPTPVMGGSGSVYGVLYGVLFTQGIMSTLQTKKGFSASTYMNSTAPSYFTNSKLVEYLNKSLTVSDNVASISNAEIYAYFGINGAGASPDSLQIYAMDGGQIHITASYEKETGWIVNSSTINSGSNISVNSNNYDDPYLYGNFALVDSDNMVVTLID